MADAAWNSARFDPYALPIFAASPPQALPLPVPQGIPWWLGPPIFPSSPANAGASPPARLSAANPWGSAPLIFPEAPADDASASAPPPKSGGMVNNLGRAFANGVPILGGALNRMDAATDAGLAPLLNPLFEPKDQLPEPSFAGRYRHALAVQNEMDQRFAADHPVLDTAANLTGGVASMAPVVRAVPWAFGVGKSLPTMAARSGLTVGGIGGADAAVRGRDIEQGAAVGGIFGAVAPMVGRLVGTVLAPFTKSPAADAVAEGRGYQPGLKAQGSDASVALKKDWASSSPIKSIEDLFAKAEENQASLVNAGDQIGREVNAEFVNPGLKGRVETQEKIDRGKPPGRINDVVRGGFVVDNPEQAEAIVKRLAERFEIVDEGWATNQQRYFDRKVLVRFHDGQVGEIQMWPPQMYAAGKQSHLLYEQARTLPPGDPRGPDFNMKIRAIHEAALAKVDQVWKALIGSAGIP